MHDRPPSPAPGPGQQSWQTGPQPRSAAREAPQPQWAPLGAVPTQYQPAVPLAPTTGAGRKRWRWPLGVLCAVCVGALVLVVVHIVLAGAAFSEIGDTRQGGRAQFGERYTDTSGAGLTVTDARTYYVDTESVVGSNEQAFEIVITVTNGTTNPIDSSLLTVNATVDRAPADPIDLDGLSAQDIAPGQQLRIPFRFTVQDGPPGPLQIAVGYADNQPVVFTGSI
jgi:hypothetical protein